MIKPSLEEYGQMLRELKDCVKVRVTTAPKQDFLTDYYRGKWLSLPLKYNFHPNQLKYVYKQVELEYCCERRQALEDVAMYHFSTNQKLRDFFFARGGTSDDSLEGHMQMYADIPDEGQDKIRKALRNWHLG